VPYRPCSQASSSHPHLTDAASPRLALDGESRSLQCQQQQRARTGRLWLSGFGHHQPRRSWR
jgi:hypothetical protein